MRVCCVFPALPNTTPAEVGGGANGADREATNSKLEEAAFRIEALEKENDRLKAALKVRMRTRARACALNVRIGSPIAHSWIQRGHTTRVPEPAVAL